MKMSTPAPTAAQVAESIVSAASGGAPASTDRAAVGSGISAGTSPKTSDTAPAASDGASASTDGKTSTTDATTGASSKATDPPKPKVSPGLEALAKRERAAVERDRDLKAREEKLTAVAPVLELVEKKDLRGLVKHMGFTVSDLVEAVAAASDDELEKPEPTPAELAKQAAREEIDAREEARKKAEQEEFDAQYAQKVQTYTASIATKAKSDPERWELINQGDVDEVAAEAWQAVERAYLEDGEKLSFEDALDIAEAHLLKAETARLEKAKGSKKLGALLGLKTSTEAATTKTGRAATPPNKPDSGTRASADEDDVSSTGDESGGPAMSRIERAMRRAGIAG